MDLQEQIDLCKFTYARMAQMLTDARLAGACGAVDTQSLLLRMDEELRKVSIALSRAKVAA